jgi:hypothetical protein
MPAQESSHVRSGQRERSYDGLGSRRIRVPLTGAGRVGRAQLLDHPCRLSLCATALGITSRPSQIQLGILRCDPRSNITSHGTTRLDGAVRVTLRSASDDAAEVRGVGFRILAGYSERRNAIRSAFCWSLRWSSKRLS